MKKLFREEVWVLAEWEEIKSVVVRFRLIRVKGVGSKDRGGVHFVLRRAGMGESCRLRAVTLPQPL